MSETTSPGTYVGDSDCNPRRILGVSTSTAAFVGAGESGPSTPKQVTSIEEYEQAFGRSPGPDFLHHAVRGFFQNGGTRCYVHRLEPGVDFAQDLQALKDLDVSVVACPDSPSFPGIAAALIAHCEEMRYRIAVIDAPQSPPPSDGLPAELRSSYAAYYYPWVLASGCVEQEAVAVPPCGHIAGIYARTDSEQGVWHAPANQAILGILGLDEVVDSSQQEVLNALGVNVLREFPEQGAVVWGARTTSDDQEWKYVNIRRLLIYLEHSIDSGLQWVNFEPNGEPLWDNVRRTVSDFLFNEWSNGALQGSKPEEGFFVRCDRTTMTQNDLDNGRLIVEIGVAPVRPAEFVIFRIGQCTADAPCEKSG